MGDGGLGPWVEDYDQSPDMLLVAKLLRRYVTTVMLMHHQPYRNVLCSVV
jgi:hypothetical protein